LCLEVAARAGETIQERGEDLEALTPDKVGQANSGQSIGQPVGARGGGQEPSEGVAGTDPGAGRSGGALGTAECGDVAGHRAGGEGPAPGARERRRCPFELGPCAATAAFVA
jgi:hypothetical protein